LCHGCNVSLGHFKHDPDILAAAIRYLTTGPHRPTLAAWQASPRR
jgi:hypothetical protein